MWHHFINQVLWQAPASDLIIYFPDVDDEVEVQEIEYDVTEV